MSGTLKGNILGEGSLESKILAAIRFKGCEDGEQDPCGSQDQMAQRLADAIADGVAKGVQTYLSNSVKTINKPTLVASGPTPHTHPNEPQYDLRAP